jgi:RNA polymerase sigma-70 factor (ECF subfamily)
MLEELEIRVLNLQFGASASKMAKESPAALLMDESVFRKFYDETSKPLLGYLSALTRDRDLAQDLLQEAYCRLLTACLPPMDDQQMRRYLFRVATNVVRDGWRGRKEASLPENPGANGSESRHWERRFQVRQAFERLKPRERQLLWLAYVEGSSHKEIADCTGLRATSIRLLLFRARRKLLDLIRAPKIAKVDQ